MRFREFWMEEDGIGVVEVILILVVLIALVLIFKEKITALVNTIFSQISTDSNKVLVEKSGKKTFLLMVAAIRLPTNLMAMMLSHLIAMRMRNTLQAAT